MSIAIVFPGQGSQVPGMGKELFNSRSEVREVFDQIQVATGVDTQRLCFDLSEEELRQTQNAQLALFTVSVAAFRCLQTHIRGHIRIEGLAGHSVGEYAALAASGILTIEDAAQLVQKRGEFMAKQGAVNPGTMAAILGLSRDQLQGELDKVEGIVVIANDNCPGQLVISGEIEAVKKAGEYANQAGARRVLPLNVSGAFHSPLMQPAADQLGKILDEKEFHSTTGIGAVYSNVTSEAEGRPERFRELLKQQIVAPVRWTETIEHMTRDSMNVFVECGVGEVLSGLIKRIHRESKCLKVQDHDTLESAVAAIRP